MTPFDTYKTYLALKNHFTKDQYDYHKYCGKVKAQLQSFYKRKDRYWFERLSRQKSDKEIVDFFVSNFIACTDPSKLWIGELMREGEGRYSDWLKRKQSLSYIFKEETKKLFEDTRVDDVFDCSKGHPIILKKYLSGSLSIETMIIYDMVFFFKNNFDKKLIDPVWESVSIKLKKYSPFLNIDIVKYRTILKECVL